MHGAAHKRKPLFENEVLPLFLTKKYDNFVMRGIRNSQEPYCWKFVIYGVFEGDIMKKGFLVLLCAGMMLTGCTDQRFGGQKEPEVYSLDLGGNAQEEESDAKQTQLAIETTQSGETAKHQELQAESTTQSSNDSVQNSEDQSYGESVQNKERARNLYTGFLNNEVPAVVGSGLQDGSILNNLGKSRAYTFEELGQCISQIYFDPEYMEKTTYDYAQYTYVECLDSDTENLLVKFVGLNIYSPDDDSFMVCVVTEKDGQLYLTDDYECWARSYTEQYRNGLCSTFGSNGAGDHYSGMSAILSNGIETYLYEAEILSGWWTSYVNGTIYNEVFSEGIDALLNVSIYTVGEEKYYTYDLSECTDDQKTLCELYIDRCRDEAGVNWVTEEQLQEAVRNRCSSIGVDYDMLEQQEAVEWTEDVNKD